MGSWRGLGLGPVFASEWLAASRRWQGYALRSLFVGTLLAALAIVWATSPEARGTVTFRGLARVGELFYTAAVGTQLTLVLLAAPAATAGAICLDRARGNLAHLLVTDLSDVEIVLGKLAARLAPVLGLVGGTLPLLSLLTLLGGVDPDAVLGAFAVTVGVAMLGCSLALVFSLWAGTTHEALLGTYLVWGLWLLGIPMIDQLNRFLGGLLPVPPWQIDPFRLAFAPYLVPGQVGLGDDLRFLGVTVGLSVGLVALAVLRLRSTFTRGESPGRRRRVSRLERVWGWLDPGLRLPGPSLDGNPVLWREWHRVRPSRWARIVVGIYVALATTFSVVAIVSGGRAYTAAWVNGLQVSIGLLLLSVTASTSLAEERARGSLDVLMATPLSTRAIVLGKWLGTFRRVPLLAILPGLVVLIAGRDGWRWPGTVLTVAFVLAGGAAVTSMGLALATWCPRLGRAVGLSVATYILVAVGWMFAVLLIADENEGWMMGSPFYWAGVVAAEVCGPGSRPDDRVLGAAVLWTLAYALAAVVLLAATLATFDGCLGRVGAGLGPPGPRRSRAKAVAGESTGLA